MKLEYPLKNYLLKILIKIKCFWVRNSIHNDEYLCRIVLSPLHVDSRKNRLLRGALAPKLNDETREIYSVSFSRVNYTSENFCKKEGHKLAEQAKIKTPSAKFQGFGLVKTFLLLGYGRIVESEKELCNCSHSGFYYTKSYDDYISKRSEYIEIQKELIKKINFVKDLNPDVKTWTGSSFKSFSQS